MARSNNADPVQMSDMRKRSKLFITTAIIYWLLAGSIVILIPLTMFTGRFFTIFNHSNYVEVANIFLKIDFLLQGHCITFVDHTVQCKKVNFYEAFYKMPSLGNVSGTMTLSDLISLLESISVQNPIVYGMLFLSVWAAIGSIAVSILAWKRKTRKFIKIVIGATGILLLLVISTLIAADRIYANMLTNELDRMITVEIIRDDTAFTVTGRLSDIGIRFGTSSGMHMLYALLVLSIFMLIVSSRWIFEVKRSRKLDDGFAQMRTVYL
jgi:hypothetical protein